MKSSIPKLNVLFESFVEEIKDRNLDDVRVSIRYDIHSENDRTAIKSWYVILTAYDSKVNAILQYERKVGFDLAVFEEQQKKLFDKAKLISKELRKKLADFGVKVKDGKWSS